MRTSFIIITLILSASVFAQERKQGRRNSQGGEEMQRNPRRLRNKPDPMPLILACRKMQVGDSCTVNPPKNSDITRETRPGFTSTCLSIPEQMKNNPELSDKIKPSDKYYCKPNRQPPRPENA